MALLRDGLSSQSSATTLFAVVFAATSGGYGHLVRGNLDRRNTNI